VRAYFIRDNIVGVTVAIIYADMRREEFEKCHANASLIAEISSRGLRKTTKETGLDRKTIRAILNGKKVKASTLAKALVGLR
jgi:hypothetical protein